MLDDSSLSVLEDELAAELENEEEMDSNGLNSSQSMDDSSLSIYMENKLSGHADSMVSIYKRSKRDRRRKISELLALRQKRKRNQTVDIFSLGCVFYYVLVRFK